MFFFAVFAVISILLLPLAYVMGILDKVKTLNMQGSFLEKLKNNLIFFPTGLIILGFDTLADMYYFWVNNFRLSEDLKQIIIVKEKSNISHMSIRNIMNICIKYNINKIKSCNTAHFVRTFSK